jgi:hypothetical protein
MQPFCLTDNAAFDISYSCLTNDSVISYILVNVRRLHITAQKSLTTGNRLRNLQVFIMGSGILAIQPPESISCIGLLDEMGMPKLEKRNMEKLFR